MGPLAETDRQQSRASGNLPTVHCSCLIAPFSGGSRRIRGKHDRRTVDLQHLIAGVVQQSVVPDILAGSRLEISATVLEAHGGMEACAINAALLAIADAGAYLGVHCLHLCSLRQHLRQCARL
jgi:ribonuclease PH